MPNNKPADAFTPRACVTRPKHEVRKFPANDVLPGRPTAWRATSPTAQGLSRALHAAFPVAGLPCNLAIARLGLRLKRSAGGPDSGSVGNPIDRPMPTMVLPQPIATRMAGWP